MYYNNVYKRNACKAKKNNLQGKKKQNRNKPAALCTLIWWVYFCPIQLTLVVSVWGFFPYFLYYCI